MSAHRFFLTAALPPDGALLPLSAEDARHAVSVLRIRSGEEIEVVEPAGAVWLVKVAEAGAHGMSATRVAPVETAVTPRPRVVLVQGVAKGDKMDAIVRQAVEVGADEIVPVLTQRSIVRLDATKRAEKGERWRRIAKSAAQQAHRASVPEVRDPADTGAAVAALGDVDALVVLWEDERSVALAGVLAPWRGDAAARVALVVGPEGGLSADEVEELRARGAVTATLGGSILRTETAAVVAVALAVHELERA